MPTLDDVWDEVDATDPDWLKAIPKGDANKIDCKALQFAADGTVRDLVQKMGEAYGCHTCNRKLADVEPRFIVDHIPPRGMMGTLSMRTVDYNFFPHCDLCASEQAVLVRRIQSEAKVLIALRLWRGRRTKSALKACREELAKRGLTPKEIALLTGGEAARYLTGHGNKPTTADIKAVNTRLKRQCHSCGSKRANYVFHADHCPPKQFSMSGWFAGFLQGAKDPEGRREDIVAALKEPYYRPQCPGCSHQQGGRVNKIVITAMKEINTPAGTMQRKRVVAGKVLRTRPVRKYGR